MIYSSYDDFDDARKGTPRVVRLRLCALSPYLTPFNDSSTTLSTGEKVYKDRFVIVGAKYGFLHDSAGGKRLWSSYQAAYQFLKANF